MTGQIDGARKASRALHCRKGNKCAAGHALQAGVIQSVSAVEGQVVFSYYVFWNNYKMRTVRRIVTGMC